MLKSFSHHSSTTSSPVLHYASASQSLPILSPSRRSSKSRASLAKSTPPSRSHYVDATTQWSPRTIVKMETQLAEPVRLQSPKEHLSAPAPPEAMPFVSCIPPPPSSTSTSQPDIPILKRGPSLDSTAPAPASSPQSSPTSKRARGDSTPVKILPIKYEFCPVEDMVVLIANMIQELIQTNDQLPPRTVVLTRFHSRTPPGISVVDYLQRLAKHATLTPPILLSMVYYIDRMCLLYPAFTVTTLTVHRFLITAATVASKGLSDAFWNNATYARVGGIRLAELGLLELDFLYRLDWKIVPNPEALVEYYQGLVERSKGYSLETDDSELDDDSAEEESGESVQGERKKESPGGGAVMGTPTDQKWNAWMSDVSAKKSDESHGGQAT